MKSVEIKADYLSRLGFDCVWFPWKKIPPVLLDSNEFN